MGDFASKGVAGSGLGLGIAGTALGLLNANGGGLGGLFGGSGSNIAQGAAQAVMAEKDAKIAQLTSEKYADSVGIGVYKQSAVENNDLRDRILGNWVQPLAQESAANRERLATLEAQIAGDKTASELREKLVMAEIEKSNLEAKGMGDRLNGKIDMVAMQSANGINCLTGTVAQIQKTLSGITQTVVPSTAISPEVMLRYNSWTAPTNVAPATQPVVGTINTD